MTDTKNQRIPGEDPWYDDHIIYYDAEMRNELILDYSYPYFGFVIVPIRPDESIYENEFTDMLAPWMTEDDWKRVLPKEPENIIYGSTVFPYTISPIDIGIDTVYSFIVVAVYTRRDDDWCSCAENVLHVDYCLLLQLKHVVDIILRKITPSKRSLTVTTVDSVLTWDTLMLVPLTCEEIYLVCEMYRKVDDCILHIWQVIGE